MAKTFAQTPAPASDRIKGSKVNKKGSATAKSSSSIQLSSVTIGTLKRKLEEFKKSNPQNKKVTLNDLKAVYRRGSGAYSSSHRPTITGGAPNSRAAWSYARVNKFLKKAAGEKVKAAYVQDDDLLKYAEGGKTFNDKELLAKWKNGESIGFTAEAHLKAKGLIPRADGEKRKSEKYMEEGGELDKKITCVNCGWHWKESQTEQVDKYICHKCGFDNTLFYPLDYAKGGKLKGTGDCYYMAGQFAMDNVFTPKKIEYIGTPYLVHAEVRGQGKIEGLRYGHAWIEDDENVYDFSNNRELIVPKVVYYAIGNIETTNPKKYVRYTFPEARQKMLKTKNYGCWDLDVEYADGGEIISKLKTPKTLTEISSIHGVDEVTLQMQLEKGIAAEKEHTDDEIIAKTIALHHIEEMPDYYDRLAKMEEEADGDIPISVFEPKIMQKEFSEGGVVVGKRHSESDDFGTGERFVIKSTGQIVEVEGGEGVICKASMESDKQYKFDGKSMTGREVASFLNHKYGGVEFAKGGKIKGSDHVCGCTNYYHGGELPSATLENLNGGEAVITVKTMESKEIYNFQGVKMTPRQILSHINTQAGGKRFEDGGIIDISKTKFDNLNKMTKMVYFTENILYS
jgi:hypothetical protein